MIIKSMSRKEPTFAQLYDYITREGDHDSQFIYTQNFILKDRDEILREFERNAELLSKRKNGNYLYHEVISITRATQISERRQKELLQDIISQYSKSRGKDCLIFGGLHDEKDNNLHYHIMISANKYNEARRYSLKKATFNKIKKQTELYVLERYPELEQAKLISKKITIGKTSNREEALKRRTGKPSLKDLFKARLTEIFANSVDKQDFFDNLRKADIEIYTRGKTIGFVDMANNRKHRLKTLGLEAEFEAVNSTISHSQNKPSEKGHSKTRDKDIPETETRKSTSRSKKTDQGEKKPQPSEGKESTISPEDAKDPEQKIINARKDSIRRKRKQWNPGKDDANKHKR